MNGLLNCYCTGICEVYQVPDIQPLPDECKRCGSLIDYYEKHVGGSKPTKPDTDFWTPKKVEARPAWYPGRHDEIVSRGYITPGGKTLICSICKLPIDVDDDGKEVWDSKGGNTHKTLPHVDHYGLDSIDKRDTAGISGVKGDWAQRDDVIESSAEYARMNTAERKDIKRQAFNASPLRVAHRLCNMRRDKYQK